MPKQLTGAEIRQQFIDYFLNKNHTFVRSASLVPGNDKTLLFTNAGMVQFKDIFLGTDKRPYTRAVNSQKCMRVSGKHNDLDDVGRDDTHHTFFEMLGNWSFGDYYKKEAITWAWDLLVNGWGINPQKLWVTCFKDELNQIPADSEVAAIWDDQPGIDKSHIMFFGRKENFWEMAETGPCGPCSEIHIDRGEHFCDKAGNHDHICGVNQECARFVELWNLVFIQYNRLNESELVPLPEKHVDTGMGLDRIVSVIQDKKSNYLTDLLFPLIIVTLEKVGKKQLDDVPDITPFRVIADHSRAAAFLIADGVIPGNIGRNYICRMIIRRASRFGTKIGLTHPFLADIAEEVIRIYQSSYPELEKSKNTIIENITREEIKFKETVTNGLSRLEDEFSRQALPAGRVIDGDVAFELYATHGLPLEIIKDEARERGFQVDEKGFFASMEKHRELSGGGKAIGEMRADDAEYFSQVLQSLIDNEKISPQGVKYIPYDTNTLQTSILGIFRDEISMESASVGDKVEILLPVTNFYIESGGQISDTGSISTTDGDTEISVTGMRRPAGGVILHKGIVTKGTLKLNDQVFAKIDAVKRIATMRNHTATHLLHGVLQRVLGSHAHQAGSLVSPEKLRFDFNHPESIPTETLAQIEKEVNEAILSNKAVIYEEKSLEKALSEGATALFGEKYGSQVRTISIHADPVESYELCGGTHVEKTGEIGLFKIISESAVAAGIRRIEAVTGGKAFELIQTRMTLLEKTARLLACQPDEVELSVLQMISDVDDLKHQIEKLKYEAILNNFESQKKNLVKLQNIDVLIFNDNNSSPDLFRKIADEFRKQFTNAVGVFYSTRDQKTQIVITVSKEALNKGYNANSLAKKISALIQGSGGGKPELAQAGGSGNLDRSDILKIIQES